MNPTPTRSPQPAAEPYPAAAELPPRAAAELAPAAAARLQASPAAATGERLAAAQQRFFALERDLGLFDRTFGDWRAWDCLRVEVHDALMRRLRLLDEKQAPQDRRLRSYLRHLPAIAAAIATRDPFRAAPADVVCIGHPRRKLEPDGTWWDPWSDPALEALPHRTLLLERPFHHRHAHPARTRRLAYLDALSARAAVRRRLPARTSSHDDAWLADLERALHATFGAEADLDVRDLARRKRAHRDAQLPCWEALFRRLQPRLVLLVVSYGNEIVVEACQRLGIPTAELQHGIVSAHHPGYHFPLPGCRKRLFPDWFLAFGDFWRTAAALPLPPERVLSVGFAYLEQRRAAYAHVVRRPQVLFLSQRSIGAPLSRLACELARRGDVAGEVVYKLHPGEERVWRREYPWLASAPVRVVAGSEPHLYELFAQSTAQVGVYSTAVLEGLAFGLRTVLVRLPGWEALAPLAAEPAIACAGDANDVAAALRAQVHAGAVDVRRFFRPGAAANVRGAVERILAIPRA